MSLDVLADVTVEIGFGVDAVGGNYFVLNHATKGVLDNVTYLLAPSTVYVNVAADVRSVQTVRGRERDLDEYSPGRATVVINDTDRTFDPSYTGSPYYGQITPMRRIRIGYRGTPIFTGFIDDWSTVYEPGDTMSRVTLECVDGFAILANQELDAIAAAYSGDLSGARISRVLDRAEIAFPSDRDIDTGNTVLGATTLGDNALAYVQACARAEAGYLYIAADGTLTFADRMLTLNAASALVLSDDPSAGVPYQNLTQRSAADLLYTRVTATSETTSVQVSATAAATSTDDFFVRTLALGTLLTSNDTQTQDLVDFYLERFSTVEERFESATFAVPTLTAGQVQALVALELTDVVTVERSPLNVGATVERLSIVDGIRHRIGHGGWQMEVSFANADTRSFLTLDHATYGVLGSNRLAF